MNKIRYKYNATMLTVNQIGQPGELIRKPILGTAEIPYSEKNLEMVKRIASDGAYEIVNSDDAAPDEAAASRDQIRIVEQGTGKTYVLYVENGKLMMEVE